MPGAYGAAPRSGGGGKGIVKVLVVVAIAIIGVAALGGGGWFAYSLLGGGRHSSPQAVFQALVQASREKDYGTALSLFPPETQRRMAGMFLTLALLQGEREPEFKSILARHGLDENSLRTKHGLQAGNVAGMLAIGQNSKLDELGAEVGDPAAFAGDVIRVVQEKRSSTGMIGIQSFDEGTTPELQDVVINGDTATGVPVAMVSGRPTRGSLTFRRIDGKWYLDPGAFGGLPQLPRAPGLPGGS